MFTPHGNGWTGLSTPAQAPADQQIGGKGRPIPRRIAELENELHQYQHSMGLLLIDKQEMAAKYDQFSQVYAEREEILKREQAAHLNAISEYGKREESIRKAYRVEKQCVADLEKALREMRSEIAEVKFVSEKKIGDVNSFQANIDEKSLLLDKKLNAADAKLAEANLTVSHADKKIKDIEARQCRYEKEKLCYETEWKAQENQLTKKDESLHDWEKRLKESQNRLVNLQRSLSGREEKLNVNDKILKIKQEELQEAKQAVDNSNVALKVEERDINNRLHKLHAYEMDINSKYKTLDKKEEILDDWEDRINMKEKKLIEDQKGGLESKIRDFELVMKRDRESLSEEMQKRTTNLQRREKDVKSKEGDLLKSEQELKWNTEMLDNWNLDLDSRSQALKKLEEALKVDEQKVLENKQHLENGRKDIDVYKQDLERTMASTKAEKKSGLKEQEILQLVKDERDEHSRMLLQLKQETEGYRVGSNSLSNEADDLRQQKLKLERAWEDLDMENAYAEEAAKNLSYERTRVESFHDSEKRRLKDVELEAGEKYKKQMEDIRLKEEAFMCDIEKQKFQNSQLLEGGRANIQHSFDLHRHKLEIEMEQKQVNKEQELEFKQSELNKKLYLAENEIRSAVELNESKIQKIIFEKKEIEKEKNALVKDQQKMETDKADIKEDIDSLKMLSRRLKERREAYKKEKNHLIGLIDKYKVCKNCTVPVFDELDFPGIKASTGTHYPNLSIECDDNGASEYEEDYEPSCNLQEANDSFAFCQETTFDSRAGEKEELEKVSSSESGSFSFGVVDNILKNQSGDTNNSMEFDANIVLNHGSGNGSSDTPEGVLHPETLNQGEDHQNSESRLRGVRRTRTMQAVIDEAKTLIGPISVEKHTDQKDYAIESSGHRRAFYSFSGATTTEQCVDNTEVYSDADPLDGPRRKRQQLCGTEMQGPGENRYNLRHSIVVNAATSSKTRSVKTRAMKAGSNMKTEASGGDDAEGISNSGVLSAQISTELQETKVQESSHMILLREAEEARTCVGHTNKNDGNKVNVKATVPDSVPSAPSDSDPGAEDSDEDGEESPTGNESVGKRIWTFFTT
uniref:Uncharacterized protein n=1 Tax=Avena sativa TaxID=4498 RepID=A0ACD6AMT5_AVESA